MSDRGELYIKICGRLERKKVMKFEREIPIGLDALRKKRQGPPPPPPNRIRVNSLKVDNVEYSGIKGNRVIMKFLDNGLAQTKENFVKKKKHVQLAIAEDETLCIA